MSAQASQGKNGGRRITPKKLSHAVMRTTRLKEMVEWYKTVLNAEIMRELPFIVFMTYDDEHHRLAFATIPGMVERPKMSAGHDHLAFTYASLGDLIAIYERLKEAEIKPFVCVNHGLTTSLYYRDPDGNGVELEIDNLEPSQWRDWMQNMSAENPFGTPLDPEELARQYHAGVPEEELRRFVPSGTFDVAMMRRMLE